MWFLDYQTSREDHRALNYSLFGARRNISFSVLIFVLRTLLCFSARASVLLLGPNLLCSGPL